MRLFGLTVMRTKAAAPATANPVAENRGGWWPLIRESWTGAWQHNATPVDRNTILSFHAVYACITLIASDIAKLRVKLMEQSDGIWTETTSPAFSPVLKKPNRYQNRIQFWECYFLSKLTRGNAYVLKVRDERGVVIEEFVLDPNRVKPLVADDGSVYYQLSADNISGLQNETVVPASEIIHDRFNCLFHPLVGTSPIYAAGIAAQQGLNIQNNSTSFFGNKSQPGGILTAPSAISAETAARLKEAWENNYTGQNAGRIAVVGDGLKYEAITLSAHDSQLIEQLKWSAEVVCSTFHVPPYKIGVGALPSYNNVQSLNVEYYSQCLQIHIESAELCLDEGLGLDSPKSGGKVYGAEFDLDGLLRMDGVAMMEMLDKGKSILKVDEARRRLDLGPVPGGDAVYRQQQDFSLEALAKRDALADPFATSKPEPTPKPESPPAANDDQAATAEAARAMFAIAKGFR